MRLFQQRQHQQQQGQLMRPFAVCIASVTLYFLFLSLPFLVIIAVVVDRNRYYKFLNS